MAGSGEAVIGVDVGGTKIHGILLRDRRLLEDFRVGTDGSSQQSVLKGIEDVIFHLRQQGEVRGLHVVAVGIGIAGFIDFERGVVTASPNLPIRNLPLKDFFQNRFGLPVVVDNDANAAALAEFRLGAGKGARHLIHLTLGTGIGGGIIIDSGLYRGASGAGAELGHMIILDGGPPCKCGSRGCLEALASGLAIERRVGEMYREGARSPLMDRYGESKGALEAKEVALAAGEGDPVALSLFKEMGHYLGIGISNLVNIFNPERVTISGGLIAAWDFFESSMRRSIEENAVELSRQALLICKSKLGDQAGALGAALLTLS